MGFFTFDGTGKFVPAMLGLRQIEIHFSLGETKGFDKLIINSVKNLFDFSHYNCSLNLKCYEKFTDNFHCSVGTYNLM